MNPVDEWFEAVRELLRIHVPVAEPRMVVVSVAKPAVVHDESLDSDTGCFLGECLLSGFIDAEGGCFPRVVENRTDPRFRCLRQNFCKFKTVHKPRCCAKAVVSESSIEHWCREFFTGRELVAEVEGVETGRKMHSLHLILLYGDAPRTAPDERPKPDSTLVLVTGLGAFDREPWVVLVAGRSATALQHDLTGHNLATLQMKLTGPATGQVVQLILIPHREIEAPCGGLLDDERRARFVLDNRRAANDVSLRIDRVEKLYEDVARDVL